MEFYGVLRKKKMLTDIELDKLMHSSPQEDPRLAQMRQSISGLPDKHREVVFLRWYDGLSYEEISQAMECPVGTVRSRIFRAREAIDRDMKPLLDGQRER